jgi:hypothetical protein
VADLGAVAGGDDGHSCGSDDDGACGRQVTPLTSFAPLPHPQVHFPKCKLADLDLDVTKRKFRAESSTL